MRIDEVHIKGRFKNLEDFKIDIDEKAMETVLIGLNATGKSNFLEALVIIFRDLDLERPPKPTLPHPTFDYYIKYKCRGRTIEINFSQSNGYVFSINGKKIPSKSEFFRNKSKYLPKHVFVYYSGTIDRLKALYEEHEKAYYDDIKRADAKYKEFDSIRPIFLVQNIHASFALIAFYMFKEREKETLQFLKEELNIHDFGSALFVLKQPSWSKAKKNVDRFWNTKGLVRRFLEDLWLFSFAPIYNTERIHSTYKKIETHNFLYLYFSDKKTFKELVDLKYDNKIQLFNALESIHLSDLLHDVKIKVLKENVNGELAMNELSEGEKQLITVLGLLKFTKDDESLILLDEPDTHLNPLWKWKYLDYLEKVVKRPKSTQIIFCTHDPLVIGNMDKSQVKIFKKDDKSGRISIVDPFVSPKGLGVAGILTSDLFGLPTTLDSDTQEMLDERNILLYKESEGKLSDKEEQRLKDLFEILNKIGFTQTYKDPLYSEFIKSYEKYLSEQKEKHLPEEHKGESPAFKVLKKMLESKK